MVRFTADLHFSHFNIIRYCKRPYKNVHEMDLALIANWNRVVKPDDTIYVLGDFHMGRVEVAARILEHLNGKEKILILGNHDSRPARMLSAGFHKVVTHAWFGEYFLVHRPSAVPKGQLALCGHIHDNWKRRGLITNVGTDVWSYTPITIEQIEAVKGDC